MSGENTHVVSRMTMGVSGKTRLFNEWNRSCVLTLSALMLLVCGVSSQADALELFQKLQPVSHLFGEPACDTSTSVTVAMVAVRALATRLAVGRTVAVVAQRPHRP